MENKISITPFQRKCLTVLLNAPHSLSAITIAHYVKSSQIAVSSSLAALVKKGKLSSDAYGSGNEFLGYLPPKDRWDCRRWHIRNRETLEKILGSKQ